MKKAKFVIEMVLDHFPLSPNKFVADGEIWLTLYLDGHPDAYSEARPKLDDLGWLNLYKDEEFLSSAYPKKRVSNHPVQVGNALLPALSICEDAGLDVVLIDADTSFDPNASSFYNLYKCSLIKYSF